MSDYNFSTYNSFYCSGELSKKASGITPLKKAQAKQLLYSTALKLQSSNKLDKKV